MAEEIKSLTLKINTQSVEEANRKLDEFSKKARNAAAATDDLTAAKKRASTVTAEELRDFERVYQNAIKSAKATRQAADEERKLVLSRKQLADSGDKLYTSFRQQIDSLKNSSASSKELEKITAQLGASYKSGNLDINNYKQLLVDVALKHKEVASAEQNASNVKINYSNQLKAQAAAQDLSKEQMLKYQSAQLGAGYSADVYFKKVTRASTATKSFEDATRTATTQTASMYLQIMKGDFSGFQTSLMSMVMQNGVGNTFSTLLTSLNPLNIGISAAIGLFGSMIPKLFEAENAAEQLAAAQEHLNKVLTTDKQSGMTFLSDEMMNLLQRNKSLVEASLKLSEKDLNKVINSAKKDLQDGFKGMESFWKEFFTQSGTNGQSELKHVLDRINSIKSSGKDLNAMLSANDQLTFDYISGIKGKIENYSEYFGITKEKAQSLLEQMAAINSETDSEKASEKINNLISEVSNLYSTTNMDSSNLDKFIKSLLDIAEKADDASLKVKRLSFLQNNMGKAVDPKKSPFYQYAQLTMTPKQRADEEIKDMKAAAKKHNKIVGKNSDDYLTDKKINDTANAIYARHLKEGRSSSTSNILQTSQQQEISLINQLNTLREQSSTLNTMTSERQKYFELQAQIETLENQSDKSKLTAQEKYILGHKEALLAQQEKNAALSEEIEQYQASIKALQQIREYTANIVSQSEIKQATFGMTSKQSNRANELIQLDKKEEGDLEKIKDPTEVAKITEEYTKAKQALEQSWQLEDQHEGDWFAGLKLGINEFAENGLNVFNGFRDIASNAMGSVSRSLTELVTTGKTDFKSLTKSILTNIIEIINKLLLAKAIQSAMGWLGGGAGGGGGAGAATGGLQQAYSGGLIHGYAKGGGVGYNNEPGGYTGNGNKYTPAGIVHKGEFVFTKESTKRIGVANLYALMREAQHGYADGGYVNVGHALPVAFVGKSSSPSNSVNVNTSVAINMQSNNSSQPQAGNINQNALEAQIKPIIQKNIGEALQRSTSPGGDLYILLNR